MTTISTIRKHQAFTNVCLVAIYWPEAIRQECQPIWEDTAADERAKSVNEKLETGESYLEEKQLDASDKAVCHVTHTTQSKRTSEISMEVMSKQWKVQKKTTQKTWPFLVNGLCSLGAERQRRRCECKISANRHHQHFIRSQTETAFSKCCWCAATYAVGEKRSVLGQMAYESTFTDVTGPRCDCCGTSCALLMCSALFLGSGLSSVLCRGGIYLTIAPFHFTVKELSGQMVISCADNVPCTSQLGFCLSACACLWHWHSQELVSWVLYPVIWH